MGGDSILLLQVVARARKAGLLLTARQVFEHQTIAALARAAGTAQAVLAPQGPVTGIVPLTPIQHWYLAGDAGTRDRNHYNQSMLLTLPEPVDADGLEKALAHLLVHHDGLRLRFVPTQDGWEQRSVPPEAGFALFRRPMPLTEPDWLEQTLAIQASLDLEHGPLMAAALFEAEPGQQGRLFIAIHHLAVDMVSWRILIEDLATAYGQAAVGKAITLPAKTSALRDWSLRLSQKAHTLAHEAPFWITAAQTPGALPRDRVAPADGNRAASTRVITNSLDATLTRALLQDVPEVYHTQINDILLTALGLTLTGWTGGKAIRFDLEGHGREALFDDLEIARTVGWFTSLFPVPLTLSSREPGEAIKAVKEQLRAIPGKGIGYGMLRYLAKHPDLTAQPGSDLCFNNLGQFEAETSTGPFTTISAPTAPDHGPNQPRPHAIVVNAIVTRGTLTLDWQFSTDLHDEPTISNLATTYLQNLTTLIAHCKTTTGGYTPSDFAQANLTQGELDKVRALLRRAK